jgi:hypothetical protein
MDTENSDPGGAPASFGQRHGLTIMIAVMGALFALVIIVHTLT